MVSSMTKTSIYHQDITNISFSKCSPKYIATTGTDCTDITMIIIFPQWADPISCEIMVCHNAAPRSDEMQWYFILKMISVFPSVNKNAVWLSLANEIWDKTSVIALSHLCLSVCLRLFSVQVFSRLETIVSAELQLKLYTLRRSVLCGMFPNAKGQVALGGANWMYVFSVT